MADHCLKSLSNSSFKSVVIYNQGYLSNNKLNQLFKNYDLDCTIIGDGKNIGIVAARQRSFEYIWNNFHDAEYVSELHLDMVFPTGWEDNLIDYLSQNDEPVISAGIIDKTGQCHLLPEQQVSIPSQLSDFDNFLLGLRKDLIISGFTHPCIHALNVLREVGGYNLKYLRGNQCFEDDSLLLSYYLYYGTRADWRPKINYNSVVYHAVASQRLDMNDDSVYNYTGLVWQYGMMGQEYLSRLHANPPQKNFFQKQCNFMRDDRKP